MQLLRIDLFSHVVGASHQFQDPCIVKLSKEFKADLVEDALDPTS